MSYLEGLMWLNEEEAFNNGRTLSNLRAAFAAGSLPSGLRFATSAPATPADIETLNVANPINLVATDLLVYTGNYTVVAGSNRRLIVAFATLADVALNAYPASMTLNGVALTEITRADIAESGVNRNIALWYLNEASMPAVGVQVLSVTMASATPTYLAVSAHCVMHGNVDTSIAPSSPQSTSTTTDTIAQSIVAIADAPTGRVIAAIVGSGPSFPFTATAPLGTDYSAAPNSGFAVGINHQDDPLGGAQPLAWTTSSTQGNYVAVTAYMERAAGTGIDDCDCYAYDLDPTQPMGPFTTLLACLPGCFTAESLNQISPVNPWYDATDARSAEFLGVWVNSVTGLDGRHNARGTTPRVAWPKGSVLSPLTPTHRTITYEVTLWATSACGLEYGMEWMEHLFAAACRTCSLGEMYVRSCCPPVGNPAYGVWTLKDVGLAEGPEWDAPIESPMASFARDATVSFYAGNPCRYSIPEICQGWINLYEKPFPNVTQPNVVGCVIPTEKATHDYAPRITIQVDPGASSPAMVFTGYGRVVDLGGGLVDSAASTGAVLLKIALLPLPAGHVMVLDGSTRRITFSGPSTNWVEIDGSAYIDASAGFVQWADLNCTDSTALVANLTASATGAELAPPRILIELIKRGGC